jgi:hypothetical protein
MKHISVNKSFFFKNKLYEEKLLETVLLVKPLNPGLVCVKPGFRMVKFDLFVQKITIQNNINSIHAQFET